MPDRRKSESNLFRKGGGASIGDVNSDSNNALKRKSEANIKKSGPTATPVTVPRKSILKHNNELSPTHGGGDPLKSTSCHGTSAVGDRTPPGKPKSVFFGDIVIFEFPNKLGDNPGVSEGAPLTIGWKHDSKNTVAVDYYEFLRQSRPRRRPRELIIPSAARDTYLLGMGYKLEQIVKAAEETKKIRRNRQASMRGNSWDKFKSVFERAIKKQGPKIVAAKTG